MARLLFSLLPFGMVCAACAAPRPAPPPPVMVEASFKGFPGPLAVEPRDERGQPEHGDALQAVVREAVGEVLRRDAVVLDSTAPVVMVVAVQQLGVEYRAGARLTCVRLGVGWRESSSTPALAASGHLVERCEHEHTASSAGDAAGILLAPLIVGHELLFPRQDVARQRAFLLALSEGLQWLSTHPPRGAGWRGAAGG